MSDNSASDSSATSSGAFVDVFVADEQDAVEVDVDRWRRLAAQVLDAEGVDPEVEMCLLFVDEPAIAALNERFMGKTGPTDVLSFPIDEEAAPSARVAIGASGPVDMFDDDDTDDDAPLMLGDVLICPTVAARNAPEAPVVLRGRGSPVPQTDRRCPEQLPVLGRRAGALLANGRVTQPSKRAKLGHAHL